MKTSLEHTRGLRSPRNLQAPPPGQDAGSHANEVLGGYTYFKTVLAPGVGEVEVWRNDKMEVLLKKKLSKAAFAQTELVQAKIRALRAKGFQRLVAVSQEPQGDAYFLEFSKKNLEDHLKICQEKYQSVAEEDLLDLFTTLVDCGANLEDSGDYHPSLTLKNIFRIKEVFKILNPYVFDSYIDEVLKIHLPASAPTKPDGMSMSEKLGVNVTQVAVIILAMGLLIPEDQLKKLVRVETERVSLIKDLTAKYSTNLCTKLKLILEGKLTTFSELKSLFDIGKPHRNLNTKMAQSSWDISPPVDLEGEKIPGLGYSFSSSVNHSKLVSHPETRPAPVAPHYASLGINDKDKFQSATENRYLKSQNSKNLTTRAEITPNKPVKGQITPPKMLASTTGAAPPMTPPPNGHRSTGALEKVTVNSKDKLRHLDYPGRDFPQSSEQGQEVKDSQPSYNRDKFRKDSLEHEHPQHPRIIPVDIVKTDSNKLTRQSLNRNLAEELTFSNIQQSEVVARYSRTPISSNTPNRGDFGPGEKEKVQSAQEFYRPSSKSRDVYSRPGPGTSAVPDLGGDKVTAIFNRLQNRFQRYTANSSDQDLDFKPDVPERNLQRETFDKKWTQNATSLRQNPVSKHAQETPSFPREKMPDPAELFKKELSSVIERNPQGALRRTFTDDRHAESEVLSMKRPKLETSSVGFDTQGYMWPNSATNHSQSRNISQGKSLGKDFHRHSNVDPDHATDEYQIGQYQMTLNPQIARPSSNQDYSLPMGAGGFKTREFRDSRDPEMGSSSKKQQRFQREQEYATLYLSHCKPNDFKPSQMDQDNSVEYSTAKKNRSVSFNLGSTGSNYSQLGGINRGRSVVKGILKKGSDEREYWSTRQDVYMHKPQTNFNSLKYYNTEDRFTQDLGSERGFKIEPTPMKVSHNQESKWRPKTTTHHEDRIDDKIRRLKNQEIEDHQQYRWRKGLEVGFAPGPAYLGRQTPSGPAYFR